MIDRVLDGQRHFTACHCRISVVFRLHQMAMNEENILFETMIDLFTFFSEVGVACQQITF